MEIREQISAVRRAKRINQATAAETIGVSLTTYCARENGHSEFTANDVRKLAELFGVPAAELVG